MFLRFFEELFKEMFFKEPWFEMFFVEPEMVPLRTMCWRFFDIPL